MFKVPPRRVSRSQLHVYPSSLSRMISVLLVIRSRPVSMSRSQHKYQPPTKKPAQKICYYYTHGGCKNGDSCPFLHVRNKEEAIAEQLNALMDIMKSNGLAAPAAAQKRQAPPGTSREAHYHRG